MTTSTNADLRFELSIAKQSGCKISNLKLNQNYDGFINTIREPNYFLLP